MKASLIISLIFSLLSSPMYAKDLPEEGAGQVSEVKVHNENAIHLLHDAIIPKAKSLGMSPEKYDIYLQISEAIPWYGFDGNCLMVYVENTEHIPYALNIPSIGYSYFMMDGYTVFCDRLFTESYTSATGQSKEFHYDNSRSRPDTGKNGRWIFQIVGELSQPKEFKFNQIWYFIKSRLKGVIAEQRLKSKIESLTP